MNKIIILTIALLLVNLLCIESKKISGRGGSGRSSSRRTNYNPKPSPTSLSYPQPSAPKPSLSGWQEKPSRGHTLSSAQSKPTGSQSHSYPSSNTGLSGNSQPKQPPSYQESVQRSNSPQSYSSQQARNPAQANNQQAHAYPASNGLSGSSGSGYPSQQGSGLSGSGSGYPSQHGSGAGYPSQGSGLSGSGAAPPPYPGLKPGTPNQPYNSGGYQSHNNYGNNYNHPQGPPPPYSNAGPSYGGYGGFNGHGPYGPGSGGYGSQMPGYFGNYGNSGRGFGGVGRTSSALTGVGIAGAGIGTVLTGLALWNLARSTGHHHHTVIYDNRGQPVAVAPANGTEPAVDPFLKDLVNCTLTISSDTATEVIEIPCAIATSFSPEADVKDQSINKNPNDTTKCTVTIVTKTGKEYMTTIPCSILLNSAAENNVTEAPLLNNETDILNATLINPSDVNSTAVLQDQVSVNTTHLDCLPEPGEIRDPINPCFSLTQNVTVIPLENSNVTTMTTPVAA